MKATPPVSLFDGYLTDPTRPRALEPVLGATHGGYTGDSRGDAIGGYIDDYKSRSTQNGALSCKVSPAGRPISGLRGSEREFFAFFSVPALVPTPLTSRPRGGYM